MNLRYKEYAFGKLAVRYLFDDDSGAVSLVLLPRHKSADCFHERRTWLQVPELVKIGMDAKAWHVGSLAHVALRHQPQGNGAGNTLKYGYSTSSLRFSSQEFIGNTIITSLSAEEGYLIEHRVRHYENEECLEVTTKFFNNTGHSVILDLLTSFSLDNLSPYSKADAQKLLLHRFRGGWSMEGKHTTASIEELNLACPWTYAFPESERFGVIGSHPVKRFFPVCAVEDTQANVFWGASLSISSSWQMELSRDSDCYSLSGGLGDCEFAGWFRNVPNGACFTAPTAYISAAENLDDLCENLLGAHHKYADRQPAQEQHLPIIFNEWCTTWGNPSHDRMIALADRLIDSPVKYLVIDAGWTDVIPNSFGQGGNGDWNYAKDRFPGGLLATSKELKKRGFITGIWFEFEVTTKGARIFGRDYDHMHLKRNGELIVTGSDRSFLDFRNPETIAYLQHKVIDFLRNNEIGYLKVDYNGSIGIGCDGDLSAGNGLYEHIQAVLAFFQLIRQQLPRLVIENCASGGHRLTAEFMQLTAMSSFSDAHEGKEIPVIGARLHRLALPRQLQIWVVLNPDQNINEFLYRLSSGFLGRLCMSGNVDQLSEEQNILLRQAMDLYKNCREIIKYGSTKVFGHPCNNIRHLTGWQAVVRTGHDQRQALAVIHLFANAPSGVLSIPLPEGKWKLDGSLKKSIDIKIRGNKLLVSNATDFSGTALLLVRTD